MKLKMLMMLIIIDLVIVIGFIFSEGPRVSAVDRMLQEIIDQKKYPAPGFSVAVVQDGKLVLAKGYGVERTDTRKPMTGDTVTAMGSLGKSFTALAALILVDQGKLKLDEPVSVLVPWFTTATPELSKKITLRMLLSNSSGLPSVDSWLNNESTSDADLGKALKTLSAVRMSREPGSSFEYSNEGFMLSGELIQEQSRMTYRQYLQKAVFDQLKMDRSTCDWDRLPALSSLDGHVPVDDTAYPAIHIIHAAANPAGSEFFTSANDMGRYMELLLNRGYFQGKRIISEKAFSELWTPQVQVPGLSSDMGGDGRDFQYALGWMIVDIEGRRYVSHGGDITTMSSLTILDPERKAGVTLLFNISGNIDVYRYLDNRTIAIRVLNILAEEKLSDYAVPRIADPMKNSYTLPPGEEQKFIGDYIQKGGHRIIRISKTDKELSFELLDGNRLEGRYSLDFITPSTAAARSFLIPTPISFQLSGGSRALSLTTSAYGVFEKRQDRPAEDYAFFEKNGRMIVLPKEFVLRWMESGFFAETGEKSEIRVYGGQSLEDFKPETAVLRESEEIISVRGDEQMETIAGREWLEKTYLVNTQEGPVQRLVCWNVKTGDWVVVQTPDGHMTRWTRRIIPALLENWR